MDEPIQVILLAAGASRRMGSPKQLLPWRGQPLIRHMAEQALWSQVGQVSLMLGANADAVAPALAGLPVTIFRNPDWAKGPGTSIRRGIAATRELKPAASLLMLCDQPLVGAAELRQLAECFRLSRMPAAASAYASDIGVPAIFSSHLFDALMSLEDAAGAKSVLRRNPERVLQVPMPCAEWDLDTPEDYQRLLLHESGAECRPVLFLHPRHND